MSHPETSQDDKILPEHKKINPENISFFNVKDFDIKAN